ncbi:MAG: hypothetical protein AAGH53_10010 [Pseudomonadota bacterium]
MPLTNNPACPLPMKLQAEAPASVAISINRRACDEALNMINLLDNAAVDQAVHNANSARDKGNHIHFCYWRDVVRMIALVQSEAVSGSLN